MQRFLDKKMKYIFLIITIFTYSFPQILAQTGITVKSTKKSDNVENVAEARFPGGEGVLYSFLENSIRYPYILVKTEMEGDIDLTFTVNTDGTIGKIQLKRGFDPLADDEVIKIIKEMPKWIPAQSGDEPIVSEQSLNIHFSLNDELKQLALQMKDSANEYSYIEHPAVKENRERIKLLSENIIQNDSVQTKNSPEVHSDPSLNRMPEFPGGQDALSAYLQENMKYPKRAIKYGVEGRAIFNIQISAEGEISKIWIFKSLFPDCDEEAFFLIKKMPKWSPGLRNGVPTAMETMIPIPFVLPK